MSGQTDRQTDKSSRWQFTAYEDQWVLFTSMPPGIAEWGWQKETCPNTQKLHYQGYLRTPSQVRFAGLKKILPGVHLEVAKNWEALVNYCKKIETRVEGETHHHAVNTFYTIYTYSEVLGQRIYTLYKDEFEEWSDQTAIKNITTHARLDIRAGHREVCCILGNPNFKTSYLAYWKDWIASFKIKPSSINAPIQAQPSPPQDAQDA